jgi:hypothetical protein
MVAPSPRIKWKYKLEKEKRSERKTLHQKTAEKIILNEGGDGEWKRCEIGMQG